MEKEKILRNVLNVFIKYRVKTFPVDCFDLLHQCGYTVITYQRLKSQNEELFEICKTYSDESFRDGYNHIIAYNEEKSIYRIRFSLAHELGHHVLNHSGESKNNEIEANYFASCLLAPRMAIHYTHCKNAWDVAQFFLISEEAAQIAFTDWQTWHQKLSSRGMIMTPLDKDFYHHFYDEQQRCFICSIKTCDFCGKTLYNSVSDRCTSCDLPDAPPAFSNRSYCQQDRRYDDDYSIFQRMEHQWLYEGC